MWRVPVIFAATIAHKAPSQGLAERNEHWVYQLTSLRTIAPVSI